MYLRLFLIIILFFTSFFQNANAEIYKGSVSGHEENNFYYVQYKVFRRGETFTFTFPVLNKDLKKEITLKAKVVENDNSTVGKYGKAFNSFGKVEKTAETFILTIPKEKKKNKLLKSNLYITVDVFNKIDNLLNIVSKKINDESLEIEYDEDFITFSDVYEATFEPSRLSEISTTKSPEINIHSLL